MTRRASALALAACLAVVLLWPTAERAVAQGAARLFGTTSTGAARPVLVDAAGNLGVSVVAATANGADSLKYTSAGTTEDEHQVKATAGLLYSITATNTNAAARYLRCANLTAANAAPGTSTPIIDLAIAAAANSVTATFPVGLTFSTALTCWLVTGAADTDVTEVAANELKVLYTFK